MSLHEVRVKNKETVVNTALKLFVEKGIEQTTIKSIAIEANLTERSVFRYFNTKADLVLETSFYVWSLIQKSLTPLNIQFENQKLSGYELAVLVLKSYGKQFFEYPLHLIYIQEAEVYLYRHQMMDLMKKPVDNYIDNNGYLSKALIRGVEDGSISKNENLSKFYYNAYDGLLGLMQKMAISKHNVTDSEILKSRIDDYCEMLVKSIKS